MLDQALEGSSHARDSGEDVGISSSGDCDLVGSTDRQPWPGLHNARMVGPSRTSRPCNWSCQLDHGRYVVD